jgi:hypothetical protein
MSVQAFEAQATAEAENELDALLAGLNASDSGSGGAAAPSEPPTTEPSSQEGGGGAPASATTSEGSEDDLDALLAGLATPDETPGDTDMDPDLAALLADL